MLDQICFACPLRWKRREWKSDLRPRYSLDARLNFRLCMWRVFVEGGHIYQLAVNGYPARSQVKFPMLSD